MGNFFYFVEKAKNNVDNFVFIVNSG